MDDKDLRWVELSREHIVKDEWIDFRKSTYRYPDGRIFEPFYSYSRRDYVVIVASDEEGRYLCVRQFRQGIREVTTEFPAGGIERSGSTEYREAEFHGTAAVAEQSAAESAGADSATRPDTALDAPETRTALQEETALEAARRELLEETGHVSDDWEHLLTIPSNATVADNYAHIFRARNCRKEGTQDLDETEVLHVVKHTGGEIQKLIRGGKFQQAVHVLAWLLARD